MPKPKTPCPIDLKDIFKIKTKEEAHDFLGKYHSWIVSERDDLTSKECMEICRTNIGYFSGYGDRAAMSRVQELFDVSHPIFGRSYPLPEEAIEAGKKMGDWAKTKGG